MDDFVKYSKFHIYHMRVTESAKSSGKILKRFFFLKGRGKNYFVHEKDLPQSRKMKKTYHNQEKKYLYRCLTYSNSLLQLMSTCRHLEFINLHLVLKRMLFLFIMLVSHINFLIDLYQ